MMLTTKGRYAVMAMADITANSNNNPVILEKISERQGITVNYLEQIFAKLRRNGLVSSVKGPGGGYLLKIPASEITIAQIIKAVDEPIKMTRCDASNTGCINKKIRCLTHDLWDGLTIHIHDYLENITISDICNKSNSVFKAADGSR
jgi:Rrf2 family iron-sulfur cluster assembly transcriptional regulator